VLEDVRIHDVEPGRRYRFTLRRPPIAGSRQRTFDAVPASSFWGEVTLVAAEGHLRIHRDDVTHIRAVAA
jgi:hypothetical protein